MVGHRDALAVAQSGQSPTWLTTWVLPSGAVPSSLAVPALEHTNHDSTQCTGRWANLRAVGGLGMARIMLCLANPGSAHQGQDLAGIQGPGHFLPGGQVAAWQALRLPGYAARQSANSYLFNSRTLCRLTGAGRKT